MMNLEFDEDLHICLRDRKKASECVNKVGFREGAEAGKEQAFQKSFDEGFQSGLKSGLQLGKYQGLLTILQNEQINLQQDIRASVERVSEKNLLHKPSHGVCQMCDEPAEPLTVLLEKQEVNLSKHLLQLFTEFDGLDKLTSLILAKNLKDAVL